MTTKFLLLVLSTFPAIFGFAQKETFDLVTYTPPNGWEKEVTESTTSYTTVNKNNNSWCRIFIIKSTISKGSIEQDFESEWQELIIKSYNPTETPQENEVQETDGWKIKAGTVKFIFNNSEAIAILTTASKFTRCVSIVATTNSQDYLKDIEALLSSVDLKKPETVTAQTAAKNDKENSIIGTWGISSTVASYYNMSINEGSIIKQYTFNANGTYSFYIKTFRYQLDKLLLTREAGTYQISGNNITINPKKSVIESWSKKNGTSDWGKLLSSQKRTLEKTTYQFTKHYSLGMQQWELVLQANKETQRDGTYNGGTAFSNAWIYSPVTCKDCFIKLPD